MPSRISLRPSLVAGAIATAALFPLVTPLPAAADDSSVSYGGLQLHLPQGWRVVDLAKNPEACLRLDQPTLYLGRAGSQAQCTGRAVGERADTVHLEPLEGAPERVDIPTEAVPSGTELPDSRPDSASGQVRYALEQSRLMATVSYVQSPAVVERIIESATSNAPSRRKRSLTPTYEPPAPPTDMVVPGAYKGEGFDACTAPTPERMKAWRKASPYRAIGIYIGGGARACDQPQLSAEWVRQQAAQGWHLMPLWVGPQPWHRSVKPGNTLDKNPAKAAEQGRAAANGAAETAAKLGLGKGTVLYNNVESYDDRDVFDPLVVSYLSAWTERLHELGYRSGAYAHKNSGIQALRSHRNTSGATTPDVLWAANWNGAADVSDSSMGLSPGEWTGRRAHQYRGDIRETHGGVTIAIDRNYLDVSASRPNPPTKDDEDTITGRTSKQPKAPKDDNPATPAPKTELLPGQRLNPGEKLVSQRVELRMQQDGNLVMYHKAGGGALWATQTHRNPGAYLKMQDDGNLVLYKKDGAQGKGGALWSSKTYKKSLGSSVHLQDDGNFVLYKKGGRAKSDALWHTGTYKRPTILTAGMELRPGQWMENKLTTVLMQRDGNLVVQNRTTTANLWASGTSGTGNYARMQDDGNFVLYSKSGGQGKGGALWSSRTYKKSLGSYLHLQNDGNFVLYSKSGGQGKGGALWSSKTYKGIRDN